MTNNQEILEALLKEAEQIQSFLEVVTSDNPDELTWRLSEINAYMARSGKMLADAQALQDNSIATVYSQHGKSIFKMPATIASKFISSQCEIENRLVTWVERINKTCVHQGDNIRTQISFAKSQMELTKKGY